MVDGKGEDLLLAWVLASAAMWKQQLLLRLSTCLRLQPRQDLCRGAKVAASDGWGSWWKEGERAGVGVSCTTQEDNNHQIHKIESYFIFIFYFYFFLIPGISGDKIVEVFRQCVGVEASYLMMIVGGRESERARSLYIYKRRAAENRIDCGTKHSS